MRARVVWSAIAVCMLGLEAYAAAPPPDPPDLTAYLAGQLERYKAKAAWPDGYCVHMPGLTTGWVFAARKASPDVTSPEIAAIFAEPGILVPGDPPPGLQAAHKSEDGTWYKYTDLARSFISTAKFHYPGTDKLNSLCFGQGSDLRVTLVEPPEHHDHDLWQRVVHYEFSISGMPTFTQTTRFKTYFHGVPHDGVNEAAEIFYWLPGHRWQIPFTDISIEQIE